MHTPLHAWFIVIPGLSDGMQNSLTVWGSCTDLSNLLVGQRQSPPAPGSPSIQLPLRPPLLPLPSPSGRRHCSQDNPAPPLFPTQLPGSPSTLCLRRYILAGAAVTPSPFRRRHILPSYATAVPKPSPLWWSRVYLSVTLRLYSGCISVVLRLYLAVIPRFSCWWVFTLPLPLPSLSTVAAIASATIPLLPPPLPLRRLPVTKQGLLRRHRHRSATIIAVVCCRRHCCCRHLPTVAAAALLPPPSPFPLLRRPVTKQVPLQRHGHHGAAFVAAVCCRRRRRCRHRPTVASTALLLLPLTLPLCHRMVTKQGPLHRHSCWFFPPLPLKWSLRRLRCGKGTGAAFVAAAESSTATVTWNWVQIRSRSRQGRSRGVTAGKSYKSLRFSSSPRRMSGRVRSFLLSSPFSGVQAASGDCCGSTVGILFTSPSYWFHCLSLHTPPLSCLYLWIVGSNHGAHWDVSSLLGNDVALCL